MFKKGDIVKCVNAGYIDGITTPGLHEGRLYTIDGKTIPKSVYVVGIPTGLFPSRFELYSKEDNVRALLNRIDNG